MAMVIKRDGEELNAGRARPSRCPEAIDVSVMVPLFAKKNMFDADLGRNGTALRPNGVGRAAIFAAMRKCQHKAGDDLREDHSDFFGIDGRHDVRGALRPAPVIDNERVTVNDVTLTAGQSAPGDAARIWTR